MNNSKSMLNLEKDKLEIINWVTTLHDNSSIERLKMLKNNSSNLDWWDEISQGEKDAIDEGLVDIKKGKVTPHKEAKKLYEKWL